MSFRHVFAGIPVGDLDVARDWWGRVLGRSPDLVPNDTEAAWRVTDGGWICLIADRERAGSVVHTLLLDDLDAFLAGVQARAIDVGPVETIGHGVLQAILVDPDGNRLKVGQPPSDAQSAHQSR